MRIVAIVQARNGSMRLPNKVMRLIQGRMMINILLDRLARSRRIDEIVVATTDHRRDDSLAAVVEELAISAFEAPKMMFCTAIRPARPRSMRTRSSGSPATVHSLIPTLPTNVLKNS